MQTLNDLLLFDKIESNMLQMERALTPCRSFLNECIRPFIRQLGLARIHLYINVDERLDDFMCHIDQHKLEQVIRNFISNAVKFTPPHGKITVSASLKTEIIKSDSSSSKASDSNSDLHQDRIRSTSISSISSKSNKASSNSSVSWRMRFEVIDTGVGISEENQKKLFGQYIQFNAGKLQAGKGSGLGLWSK